VTTFSTANYGNSSALAGAPGWVFPRLGFEPTVDGRAQKQGLKNDNLERHAVAQGRGASFHQEDGRRSSRGLTFIEARFASIKIGGRKACAAAAADAASALPGFRAKMPQERLAPPDVAHTLQKRRQQSVNRVLNMVWLASMVFFSPLLAPLRFLCFLLFQFARP
jgi:hypothetical protein